MCHMTISIRCCVYRISLHSQFGIQAAYLRKISINFLWSVNEKQNSIYCESKFRLHQSLTVIFYLFGIITITSCFCRPSDAPSWQYWMGVNKAGERGFFSPTDCVPVMPESSPMAPRSTKSLQNPPKSKLKSFENKPKCRSCCWAEFLSHL